MNNIRCECGKILCQVYENMIVIKCRHCKRFLIIKFNGLTNKSSFQYDYSNKFK